MLRRGETAGYLLLLSSDEGASSPPPSRRRRACRPRPSRRPSPGSGRPSCRLGHRPATVGRSEGESDGDEPAHNPLPSAC